MSQIWDTSYSVPVTLTWIAVAVAAVSLFIRRRTWRIPGEVAASTAVLFLALGTFLSSDECNIGEALWRATGFGYLDDFAGQLCYVSGTLALLQHALYRVADDAERAEIVDAFVKWPVTLLVPLMLSAMYMSPTLHDEPLAFDVMAHGSGLWGTIYRSLYLACMLYLTLLLVHVLRTVRRTGGRGKVSVIYLLACSVSLTVTTVRVAEMVWPDVDAFDEIPVMLRATFGMIVATGAAASWLGKLWRYRSLLLRTRTTRRQRRNDTLQSHRERLSLTSAGVTADGDEPDPPPHQLTPANGQL
ncbi:membrane protein [Mycobacterium Phage TribleTrouble]|nr:membrane protein [Mycobacterium Phage TribleTrouble]